MPAICPDNDKPEKIVVKKLGYPPLYESFGQPVEQPGAFYKRISERLCLLSVRRTP